MAHPSNPARNAAFAKRLKALMDKQGLTASDLAAKMWGRVPNAKGYMVAKGKDRISEWLNEQSFPVDDNLALLAKTLGVAVTDIAPDAELHAVQSPPAASLVVYPDGQAMVDIHRMYPLEVALAIMKLAGTTKP
jgi:transcriptional regulator with XRE-family HTH domain